MQGIICGLGLIKQGSEYYYTDCCGNFISGFNNTGGDLEVSFNYDLARGGVGKLNVPATTSCPSPTPTPTQTVTPTNTTTPTQTPTNTQTPTPSITPSITPSNSPVTRLKNSCDVVTIFDMGISCNVIQNPSSPTSLDGIISVNVTGGTAPYSYFWAGGQRTQTLFGVPQGVYEVVVTDYKWPDGAEDGVSDFTASTICSLVGPSPTTTPTMTPTPSNTPPIQCVDLCMTITNEKGVVQLGPVQFTCNGLFNGQFSWFGEYFGKPLYILYNSGRYQLYNDDQGTSPYFFENSIVATDIFATIPLSGWQYYGGFASGNVSVSTEPCPEYPPLSLSLFSNNNSCRGMINCDGSITANAQGGVAPYYYSINDGVTTQTSPTFNNLCPNNYIVTLYDSVGNVQSSTVEIGFNTDPITYQLSVVDYGTPVVGGVPNSSTNLTKNYKIQSNPPIPVGTSVTFNLTFSNTKTYSGPGNGTINNTFIVYKNGVQQTPTLVSNTPVVINRPNCSPNLQTGATQTNSITLTMSAGDDFLLIDASDLTLTNPLGSAQTNCTTKLTQTVSSNITQVSVSGNECATAIGSQRTVLENSITYIPPVEPPVLLCFGYLYNFYAITGSTSQSLTSSDNWSVPTQTDFQTLVNSVSNNARALKLVNTTTYWNSLNSAATNTSGFSAKGSGIRDTNDNLGFGNLRQTVNYHSKTTWNLDPTKTISLFMASGSITPLISALVHNNKTGGSSVRLVRNTTPLLPGQTGTYIGNDGKSYNTICIGTQEWMSEDLRETEYRNSSPIPNVTSQSVWSGLTTGAYCIYNNDSTNVAGCSENLP